MKSPPIPKPKPEMKSTKITNLTFQPRPAVRPPPIPKPKVETIERSVLNKQMPPPKPKLKPKVKLTEVIESINRRHTVQLLPISKLEQAKPAMAANQPRSTKPPLKPKPKLEGNTTIITANNQHRNAVKFAPNHNSNLLFTGNSTN